MWQDDKGCNTADEEQYSLHQFQVVFVLFSSRRLFGHGSSMEDLFFSFFVDGTSLPETAYLRMGNRSWQWLPLFSGHQLVCYGSIPHNTNDPFHSTYLYSSVPVFSCPIGLCSTGLDVDGCQSGRDDEPDPLHQSRLFLLPSSLCVGRRQTGGEIGHLPFFSPIQNFISISTVVVVEVVRMVRTARVRCSRRRLRISSWIALKRFFF